LGSTVFITAELNNPTRLEDLKKTQGKLPRFKKAVQNPVHSISKAVHHGLRFAG
jgi:hypothetical protein